MIVSSVLSALLLGLLPGSLEAPVASVAPLHISEIAPPAEEVTIPRRLSASGVVVLDLKTGQLLYQSQGDIERPMASLTKLMTALVIVENHDLSEWVTVPKSIGETQGNVAYLPPGEQFTVGDLLSALLIASANDAAVTLARFHSGSEEAFVAAMNDRATALGLTGTHYANPSGLDHPRQWSTPRDIAHLVSFVDRMPAIRSRMGTRSKTIVSRAGRVLSLTHTHALLLRQPSPIVAGKTGTTGAAGQCLVSIIQTKDREYAVVLLHSLQRYKDMQVIMASLLGPDASDSTPVEDTECVQGGGCPVASSPLMTPVSASVSAPKITP